MPPQNRKPMFPDTLPPQPLTPLTWQDLMEQQVPVQEQSVQNVAGGGTVNLPPLSPQAEDSLLSAITHKTLGGIGYVGGLIDKYTGARAMRGLLGGRPRELLSILPGSDAFGITDESQRVSGRDLTDQLGLSDKGSDSWGDMGLGVAADILTSPATYLSFGTSALTKAGEAAAKAGQLPGLMDRMRQGLGGVVKVGIPFGPSQVFGANPQTAEALSALGSAAGGAAKAVADLPGINTITHPLAALAGAVSEPIGRYGKALFNYRVKGATSAAGQKAAQVATAGEEAGLAGARGRLAEITRNLADLGALDQPALIRGIAEAAEGAASPLDLAAPNIGVRGRAINENIDAAKAYMNELRAKADELGFKTPDLEDLYAQYFPRHMQVPDVSTKGYGGRSKIFNTQPTTLEGREEILKNIPRGTAALNELSMDPEVSGILGRYGPTPGLSGGLAPTTPLQREEMVRRQVFGFTPEDEALIPQYQARMDEINKAKTAAGQSRAMANQVAQKAFTTADPKDAAEAAKWNSIAQNEEAYATQIGAQRGLNQQEQLMLNRYQQSKPLTRWAESLDPKYATENIPFFGRHPLDDLMTTVASTVRRNEAGNAIQSMFADLAVPADQAGPGFVPVQEALKRAGFDNPATALANFAQRKGYAGNPADLGLTHYLPPEVVTDASRFTQGFQLPDVLKPLASAIDWFTNLTKTFQTTPFLAFHTRNFVSGQFANYMLDAFDPRYSKMNPLAWIAPIQDAYTLLKGGTINGASELPVFRGLNLTDEVATRKIANLAFQHRAAGKGFSLSSELLTPGEQAAELTRKIPGMQPYSGIGENLKQGIPQSLEQANPLNVAGVNANRDVNSVVKAGRMFGEMTEDVNRLSGFIAQLRQGYAPEVAAMRTRAAQVDYSALSPFEKNVMRRLVPFYSYTRGIVPFVLDNLVSNPGGLGGQLAAASYELRNQNQGFVPDYLGNGLAIPIGKEENGQQRFLTRLDNPVEAAAGIYNGGGFDKTVEGLLGQMNPLIKGPLEFATGKQFFTGRDLADLYPMTGETLIDQAMMNSPLSRLATTYRTLTDERKWADPIGMLLNLGTGAKVSDIDMERQRDLAARNFISETLRGQQGIGRFETIYPRPEAIQSLTTEEIALLRLSKTLEQRAEKQAKEKKAGKIGLRFGG